MNIENEITRIIDETIEIIDFIDKISTPIVEEEIFLTIKALLDLREQHISQLFKDYSTEELSHFSNQFNRLNKLDKQLVTTADQVKEAMAKQILKQKNNSKATTAYSNNT
jgi:hypothetical protein